MTFGDRFIDERLNMRHKVMTAYTLLLLFVSL